MYFTGHSDYVYRDAVEAAISELESAREDWPTDHPQGEQSWEEANPDDADFLALARLFLEAFEQCDDDSLISEHQWREYAEEWADACMEIPDGLRPYFDMKAFARDLQMDYTALDIDGTTYYSR